MKLLLGHLGPKFLTIVALTLGLSGNPTPAQAGVILSWETTVQGVAGNSSATIGEKLQVQMHVDNGGSSILSQTWNLSDFVKYRIEGASGWWVEATGGAVGPSSARFTTDAMGDVTSAGLWVSDGYVQFTSSFDSSSSGQWSNSGGNSVAFYNTASSNFSLDVAGGTGNQVGSNWSASVASVPEPSSVMMLGLLGCAGIFKRRRRGALAS